MKILHDVIDVCLLRFKPLVAYEYPRWQVLAVLAGVSLSYAPALELLQTDTLTKAAFVFAMKLLQYIAMARFFTAWLRLPMGRDGKPLSSWDGQGDLLTILVLAQGLDFLAPLTLWLDPGLSALLALFLLVYGFVILVRALAVTTGATVRVITLGLFICTPILLLIQFMAAALALDWGWIDQNQLMRMFQVSSEAAAMAASSAL